MKNFQVTSGRWQLLCEASLLVQDKTQDLTQVLMDERAQESWWKASVPFGGATLACPSAQTGK